MMKTFLVNLSALIAAFDFMCNGFLLTPSLENGVFTTRNQQCRGVFSMSSSDDKNEPPPSLITVDDDGNYYEPKYGVSFIGGDPCGSKYNTDPHDAQVEKPGMPNSMKARIQYLAEKLKRKEKEAVSNSTTEPQAE